MRILALLIAICSLAQEVPVDTSIKVEATRLRPVLTALQPIIENGLGERQIAQIEQTYAALAVNDTAPIAFPIIHKGIKSDLRVIVRKPEADIIELRFLATPLLAKEIASAIETINQHEKETRKLPTTNDPVPAKKK